MSRTLSLVAGGTAAVVLLGITTSFVLREPAPAPGALGGPVVVEGEHDGSSDHRGRRTGGTERARR